MHNLMLVAVVALAATSTSLVAASPAPLAGEAASSTFTPDWLTTKGIAGCIVTWSDVTSERVACTDGTALADFVACVADGNHYVSCDPAVTGLETFCTQASNGKPTAEIAGTYWPSAHLSKTRRARIPVAVPLTRAATISSMAVAASAARWRGRVTGQSKSTSSPQSLIPSRLFNFFKTPLEDPPLSDQIVAHNKEKNLKTPLLNDDKVDRLGTTRVSRAEIAATGRSVMAPRRRMSTVAVCPPSAAAATSCCAWACDVDTNSRRDHRPRPECLTTVTSASAGLVVEVCRSCPARRSETRSPGLSSSSYRSDVSTSRARASWWVIAGRDMPAGAAAWVRSVRRGRHGGVVRHGRSELPTAMTDRSVVVHGFFPPLIKGPKLAPIINVCKRRRVISHAAQHRMASFPTRCPPGSFQLSQEFYIKK
ncbi:hypothetical protein DFJ73DRAFT_766166 [Zopfochytrium polystomum]|nr:hypothetical protein DFJ73DRAFT_766166 [Zopfochytrium polystomum]